MNEDYNSRIKKVYFLLNYALSHLPPNEEENHPFKNDYELNVKLARRNVLEAYSDIMNMIYEEQDC